MGTTLSSELQTAYRLTKDRYGSILARRQKMAKEAREFQVFREKTLPISKIDVSCIRCQSCRNPLVVGDDVVSRGNSNGLTKIYHRSCARAKNII